MTVSNNYAPVITAANGVTTVFTASWNALAATNVVVQLLNTTTGVYTTVMQGTGSSEYQVTTLTATSLVITFNTAPASGNNVVISRETAQTQTIPYTTSRGFQGVVEETSFDSLTNMVQELNDLVGNSIQVSVGDTPENLVLPIASLRANQYLAFDASGNVIVSSGTGGTTSASQVSYSTSGGVTRTVQSKLSDVVSVLDFGADPTGTNDSTIAIQAAINSLSATGGTVYFPPGTYKISSTLQIGNGNATTFSTYKGVVLQGAGSGVLPGPGNASAVTINSSVAGAAILIQGPIGSWGIENICINITTTSTSALGLKNVSGQFGRTRNLMITGCYGTSIMSTTVGTSYTAEHNYYESTAIYLPSAASAAIGIFITGAGASGGSTGTAFDEWHNTSIIINNTGQVGRILQYCDNINFFNTEIVNGANGTAVQYNYSSTGTNGTSFPSDCRDYGIEIYGNSVLNYSPSGIGSIATSNRMFGFSLANGATVPALPNLSVLNEAGSSKAVIFLNGAQSIGASSTKVTLDTKVVDNDTIISTSNHRITPIRPGYYQIDAQITCASFAGASSLLTTIIQNGSTQLAQAYISNNGVQVTGKTSVMAHFNGTSDYVEMYGYITGGSTALSTGQQQTFLSMFGPF